MTIRRLAIASLGLMLIALPAFAGKKLEGRWTISVTFPTSASDSTKRTSTLNLDVSPREGLHGRITITDDSGNTFGGVYRQDGKKVSITYELPCDGSNPDICGSVVLKGKIKNAGASIKGSVVVMWDTDNAQNPALFDTSNGSFSGTRLQ